MTQAALDGLGAEPALPAALATARPATNVSTRLLYGLGSMAFGIKDNGFQTILLLFYNQVVGLPAALVGVAIMLALAVDAVMDPIIGQISDNLRTPWGRRHPLMYAAALPLGASYLLLWTPPHASQGAQFLHLVLIAVLVRTFISLYEAPSAALAPSSPRTTPSAPASSATGASSSGSAASSCTSWPSRSSCGRTRPTPWAS